MPDLRLSFALILLLAAPWLRAESTLPGSDQRMLPEWREARVAAGEPAGPWVNRLALSGSAYLFGHADNPIDWHPWNAETLDRAAAENRLIFLSIGYDSCHWCHVMEKESFSDAGVAAALNAEFLSIKVDREAQPDIDFYYSLAAELVRGEAGWPLTAVLTPDGQVFAVYSYVGKAELIALAQRSASLWRENPDWVRNSAALVQAQLDERLTGRAGVASFDASWPEHAEQALLARRDAQYGGFGEAQKLPGELKLQFLLDRFKRTASAELETILRQELDRLMLSGMNDVVFGGLFRYTTDRAMRKPHFEKMLYNQALALRLYSEAGDWLEDPRYRAFAGRIIDFVEGTLVNQAGLVMAATDADHQGVEGGFYLWPAEDVKPAPGGLETVSFADERWFLFPVSDAGLASAMVAALASRREGRPRVVENVVTAWNALWISALLQAGEAASAARLGETLWRHAWRDGALYRLADQPAYLDDHAYLAAAFRDLYLASGEPAWLERAKRLTAAIQRLFLQEGRLYYQSAAAAAPARLEPWADQVLPAAAAVALAQLMRRENDPAAREVTDRLASLAWAEAGASPENHLSLLQLGGEPLPTAAVMIAAGHGAASLRPDSAAAWRLDLRMAPGWHVNAERVLDDYLIPTRVTSIDGSDLRIDWPEAVLLETAFSENPLLLFEGAQSLRLLAGDERRLDVSLRLQACNDEVCLPPETHRLTAFRRNP